MINGLRRQEAEACPRYGQTGLIMCEATNPASGSEMVLALRCLVNAIVAMRAGSSTRRIDVRLHRDDLPGLQTLASCKVTHSIAVQPGSALLFDRARADPEPVLVSLTEES